MVRSGISVSRSTHTRCTSVSSVRLSATAPKTNQLSDKVAADGHYTKVQVATSILIPIGERYQFFVKLDQTPGDYIIRTAAVVLPQLINGYAILSYTSTGTTGAGLVSTTTLPAAKNAVSTPDFHVRIR